jgi:hypothetical protein
MNITLISELGLQGITGTLQEREPSEIEAFERMLGTLLPSDFKEFILKYAPSLFGEDVAFAPIEQSAWAVGGLETMDVFYGISDNPGFDIRRINERLRDDIPKKTIAIGHDAGSNLILISLENATVLFLDRETGKTTLIANNFNSFLNSFKKRE